MFEQLTLCDYFMKLFIRNMISSNCIPIIRMELNKLGYHQFSLTIGELDLAGNLTAGEIVKLEESLKLQGYTLLDEKNSKLIGDVKKIIVNDIFFPKKFPSDSYNRLLSRETSLDYELINNLFTEIMGMTIECYVLFLKIEKAKELLIHQSLSISNVAKKAGFHSTANLVNNFKKNIGVTPHQFKVIKKSGAVKAVLKVED